MAKTSSGILIYKVTNGEVYFLLVHPGGPFYKNKNEGVWSIVKGEFSPDEDPLTVAIRELKEETGQTINGIFTPLEPVIQKGGKIVYAWAVKGEIDVNNIVSNSFDIEWPPRSGKKVSFPEVDKAAWFTYAEAKQIIISAQYNLLTQVMNKMTPGSP